MLCRCKYLNRLDQKLKSKISPKLVYLDNCATTPVDNRVLAAFEKCCKQTWGNPSSIHPAGLSAARLLDECKITIAKLFQCSADQIYFCSGGTEAIHGAVFGLKKKKRTFFAPTIEHSSILRPLEQLKKRGYPVSFLKVDSKGRISLSSLEKELKQGYYPVIFYSPVNHETGSLQWISELYQLKKHYPLTIVMDAVQTASRLEWQKWVPYCDILTLSSHKIYAPKGTGLLILRNKEIKLRPFRYGGKQEGGIFPGTQNVPGIAAATEALRILSQELPDELKILRTLSREGEEILQKETDAIEINTPENKAAGILNISLKNVSDMENFIMELSLNGICLSRFSACHGRLKPPSEILLEMGYTETRASFSLRISCGRFNNRDDFFRLARFIKNYQPTHRSKR